MRLVLGSDGLVRLEYQITAPDIVERRQDAELSLGMFLNVIRECCGRSWAPEEVHFEHPRPAEAKEHEGPSMRRSISRSRPTPCSSGPTVLSRAMPHGDLRLMALMRMSLVELRERKSVARIAARPGAHGNPHEAAERLPERWRRWRANCAYRAWRSAASCTTATCRYKELVEGTRRELALSYMRQRQLPFSEIAMLLGYSELSAFSGRSAGGPAAVRAPIAPRGPDPH